MFVFFYDDEEIFSQKILRGLEKIDDELDATMEDNDGLIQKSTVAPLKKSKDRPSGSKNKAKLP